jgi:drug/metabolite transporter (DMT)-like permease
MANRSDVGRRVLGALFLIIAAGMLIAGQTVWQSRLQQQPSIFVYYWSVCFVFTALTLVTALLDVRAVRRRSRREQTELVKKTWSDITTTEKSFPPPSEDQK